jgi:D-alanyl-D-alanine carboxypeptidase (penicillin-binding protein 5/6)
MLVFDMDQGTQAISYNADTPLPIASVSKIMTGYLALKNFPPDKDVSVSAEAIETEGLMGNFAVGERFTIKDLLRAAMMSSSNDSAMALAEAVGEKLGGQSYEQKISLFVEEMNKQAQAFGMTRTVFKNPTGLDEGYTASNYSSADDLGRLIRATRSTPILWEVTREDKAVIYSLTGSAHKLENLNLLASHIPLFLGGKTGSTDAAGESLVLLFEYPLGDPHALVLLGAGLGRRFVEAEELLRQIMPVLQ